MNWIEELERGVETATAADTEAAAAGLAAVLPVDVTLALYGDMGSGKTTFVKGLAKAWGITQPVTSPTFAILSLYRGKRMLLHLDAYRLESAGAGEDLLIDEFAESPFCLCVEWPERLGSALPSNAWRLYFHVTGETRRRLRLERGGA